MPWACHKALHRQFLPFFFPHYVCFMYSFFLDLFLFFKKFILLFSIVDLQCCIKFCCTEKWLSSTNVHMYILSHVLFCHGLSQVIEYSFLCYTVGPCCLSIIHPLHLLVPKSQAPSPLATTSLFSMSLLSLSLLISDSQEIMMRTGVCKPLSSVIYHWLRWTQKDP